MIKNWEKEFDKIKPQLYLELSPLIKNKRKLLEILVPYEYQAKQFIKDFANSLLDELEMEDNSLETEEKCETFLDHDISWDGNYYTCEKCGEQFKSVKNNNSKIKSLRELLK